VGGQTLVGSVDLGRKKFSHVPPVDDGTGGKMTGCNDQDSVTMVMAAASSAVVHEPNAAPLVVFLHPAAE
jgi:hypothetical protein